MAVGVEVMAMATGIVVAAFSENKKTEEDYGERKILGLTLCVWMLKSVRVDRCVRNLPPRCQRGCYSVLLISGQVVCKLEMRPPGDILQVER